MMIKKKRSEKGEHTIINDTDASDNKDVNSSSDNNTGSTADTKTDSDSEDTAIMEENASDKIVEGKNNLEEKLAEMQDKYIRLSAEFDNYRKRTLREKIEISKYAGENLLINILPVMDDFDRALTHMETAADCTSMKEGIDLIHGKFMEFLLHNGVKEIEALNCPFNVDLHDAVAKVEVEEKEKKGRIVDVVQKGYYLQDKIIRHSKVVVGE